MVAPSPVWGDLYTVGGGGVYWHTFGGAGILVWISPWKLHTGVYLLLGSASTRLTEALCWRML